MLIPCDQIQASLKRTLLLQANALKLEGKLGRLVSIVVGENLEQESYVKIKKRIGEELGIEVEKKVLSEDITNAQMIDEIKNICADPNVAGIIIQQPMPKHLDVEKIYDSIPTSYEIEGHVANSAYIFPLVQACMIGLEWVYRHKELNTSATSLYEFEIPVQSNLDLFRWLNSKNIVIAGNGITTGLQIAKHFNKIGVKFTQTDSKTHNSDETYRNANIIITGVGKRILHKNNLKKDVMLLNFGLHREEVSSDGQTKSHLTGDYNESEIENIASIYTKTPGGLGPIDVLCLFGNLITACKNSKS